MAYDKALQEANKLHSLIERIFPELPSDLQAEFAPKLAELNRLREKANARDNSNAPTTEELCKPEDALAQSVALATSTSPELVASLYNAIRTHGGGSPAESVINAYKVLTAHMVVIGAVSHKEIGEVIALAHEEITKVAESYVSPIDAVIVR